jgi:hypothetical protein
MHVFVSYNHRDERIATRLAAQLRLAGADVWIDEWEIEPGDSIPGKVNEALAIVDTVVVLWSANAASSAWVHAELGSALARSLNDGSLRVIPIRLDGSQLPPLLGHLSWLRVEGDNDVKTAVRRLMGLDSHAALLIAIQRTIEESGIQYELFPGYGPAVGCPECGAPAAALQGWTETDFLRDDQYAGVRCTRCNWQDGGEM